MSQTLFHIDAFTSTPFGGNPAAIGVLKAPGDERWMQTVAAEMNLSETAFLWPEKDGYRLRWFTPTQEVALCGHATLATAHLLWEQKLLAPAAEARFYTLSGLLKVNRKGDWMEMDFPVWNAQPETPPPGLDEALGMAARWFGRFQPFGLALLDSAEQVRSLRPDLSKLIGLPLGGLVVTAPGEAGVCDFVSRVFAPKMGISEDPVTGSTHCMLAPFWAEKLNKPELLAHQVSQRGGVLRVAPKGDRVFIQGQAVTIMRSELLY